MAYGYDNTTGNVVAYGGGNHVTDPTSTMAAYARQCAVAAPTAASDHVTSTYAFDRDAGQATGVVVKPTKRSRVSADAPEMTSSSQHIVDRYQLMAAATSGAQYKKPRCSGGSDYGLIVDVGYQPNSVTSPTVYSNNFNLVHHQTS